MTFNTVYHYFSTSFSFPDGPNLLQTVFPHDYSTMCTILSLLLHFWVSTHYWPSLYEICFLSSTFCGSPLVQSPCRSSDTNFYPHSHRQLSSIYPDQPGTFSNPKWDSILRQPPKTRVLIIVNRKKKFLDLRLSTLFCNNLIMSFFTTSELGSTIPTPRFLTNLKT